MAKHIITDGDGTLFQAPNPYLVIAETLGCTTEIQAMIDSYLQNRSEQSYEQLCRDEIQLFVKQMRQHNLPISVAEFNKLIPTPKLIEGSDEFIQKLVAHNSNVHVLSSGFLQMMSELKTLGIAAENIHANEVYSENATLEIKINVSGQKIQAVLDILNRDAAIKPQDVAYFGDNQWDLTVMRELLKLDATVYLVEHPVNYDDPKKISAEDIAELSTAENFKIIRGFANPGLDELWAKLLD